jgi:HAD superfamily hydrolase (TIGR01458 family)
VGLIEGVLLDVDGVLATAWQPIPGAGDTIRWLRDAGVPFLLATNASVSRSGLAERLRGAGIEVSPDRVVNASSLTAAYLRTHHPGGRCFLVGEPELGDEFRDIAMVDHDPDVVVVAGADRAFTWKKLSAAFRMVRDGAALIAMHRNLSWVTEGGLMLDTGAFLVGLERAAGVEAVVTGKPAPAFFRQCLEVLGVPADRTAMVGDDLEADVLAAQDVGLRGILVRTGKYSKDVVERSQRKPDGVIDSVADLPGLLE